MPPACVALSPQPLWFPGDPQELQAQRGAANSQAAAVGCRQQSVCVLAHGPKPRSVTGCKGHRRPVCVPDKLAAYYQGESTEQENGWW